MTQNKNTDPLVYILRQNGKHVGICLSSIGKWVAGIVASVLATTIVGLATFAFWSVSTITRIESTILHTASTIDKLEKKVGSDAVSDKERLDGLDARIRELEKGSEA